MNIVFIHVPYCHFLYHELFPSLPPSLPPSLSLSLPHTQTTDQEPHVFFTSTMEDQPWPSTRTASHEGEEDGEGGGGGGERREGGGEGRGDGYISAIGTTGTVTHKLQKKLIS